jgi:putative N6-adenine-specific DNA methylase
MIFSTGLRRNTPRLFRLVQLEVPSLAAFQTHRPFHYTAQTCFSNYSAQLKLRTKVINSNKQKPAVHSRLQPEAARKGRTLREVRFIHETKGKFPSSPGKKLRHPNGRNGVNSPRRKRFGSPDGERYARGKFDPEKYHNEREQKMADAERRNEQSLNDKRETKKGDSIVSSEHGKINRQSKSNNATANAERSRQTTSKSATDTYAFKEERNYQQPRNLGTATAIAKDETSRQAISKKATANHFRDERSQQPKGTDAYNSNEERRRPLNIEVADEQSQHKSNVTSATYNSNKEGGLFLKDNGANESYAETERNRRVNDNEEESKAEVKHLGPLTRKERKKIQFPKPPDMMDCYVVCHPGLEKYLSEELAALGVPHQVEGYGAKLSVSTVEDVFRCHLYLGTASEVLIRCGKPFECRALGELTRKVERLPWKQLLSKNAKLKLIVTSQKSRLLHTTAIRDRILEGIYSSLGVEKDVSEYLVDADEVDNVVRMRVEFKRDKCQLSVYTSTTPIHQRNYRFETGKAPLREDLAFALLYSAGWKPALGRDKSDHIPVLFDGILDPFCGSGTIPIEAASIASNMPPGRLRPAPCQGLTLFNDGIWQKMLNDSTIHTTKGASQTIRVLASDRDKGAIQISKSNAERAGVADLIDVSTI